NRLPSSGPPPSAPGRCPSSVRPTCSPAAPRNCWPGCPRRDSTTSGTALTRRVTGRDGCHDLIERRDLICRVGRVLEIALDREVVREHAVEGGEGADPGAPVVAADPAVADTAERESPVRNVHDGVVDTAASERDLGEHLLGDRRIAGENVERERLGLLLDLRD